MFNGMTTKNTILIEVNIGYMVVINVAVSLAFTNLCYLPNTTKTC